MPGLRSRGGTNRSDTGRAKEPRKRYAVPPTVKPSILSVG